MDYAQWEGKQMGSYGEGAGAAYVFSRSAAAEGFVWAQDQVTRSPQETALVEWHPWHHTRNIYDHSHS